VGTVLSAHHHAAFLFALPPVGQSRAAEQGSALLFLRFRDARAGAQWILGTYGPTTHYACCLEFIGHHIWPTGHVCGILAALCTAHGRNL
jgi:hypothetical protein